MFLIDMIKKRRRAKMFAHIRPYTELAADSVYNPAFKVELRNPERGRIYLRTGHHCVLEGRFIFETEGGEVTIGDRVHIGGSMFVSVNGIHIGNDVTIAWDCLFYDHNSHSVNWEERKNDTEQEYQDIRSGINPIQNKDWTVVRSAPITICDKVWIGVGAKILKGVTIGEGAVVGAGSVVTRDVEPWSVVGGNPAKVIKYLRGGEVS